MFIIMSRFVYIVLSRLLLSDLSLLIVFAYFSLPWSTLVEGDEQPVPLVSYSVHEGKHFFVSAVSGLFLKLIYNGASMVGHLLLLKFSMHKEIKK